MGTNFQIRSGVNGMTGKIWNATKMILALALFLAAVRCREQAEQAANTITVMLGETAPGVERAEEIKEAEAMQEHPGAVCFWTEQQDCAVACRETGNSGSVTVVLIKGNADLVMPGCGSLAWRQRGCFLDTVTAQELFGTKKADGQVIWCGEEPYTVCGTFESTERIMVRTAAASDGTVLGVLSLDFGAGGNRRDQTEQFLMRYGLAGNRIDFYFLSTLAGNMFLLFPLVVAVRLVRLFWKDIKNSRWVGIPLAVTIGAALFVLVRNVTIPEDMIPSEWSDFSFWANWWKGQKENLLLILGTSLGERQLAMVLKLGGAVLLWMGSMILL